MFATRLRLGEGMQHKRKKVGYQTLVNQLNMSRERYKARRIPDPQKKQVALT